MMLVHDDCAVHGTSGPLPSAACVAARAAPGSAVSCWPDRWLVGLTGLRWRREPVLHPLQPVAISRRGDRGRFLVTQAQGHRGEVTIPDCFAKFEKDGALANFDKIRDGAAASISGPPWYDGLTYEMIRASADFLAAQRDAALESATRRLHSAHCGRGSERPGRLPEYVHAIERADASVGTQRRQRQLATRRLQRRLPDRRRSALLPRHGQDDAALRRDPAGEPHVRRDGAAAPEERDSRPLDGRGSARRTVPAVRGTTAAQAADHVADRGAAVSGAGRSSSSRRGDIGRAGPVSVPTDRTIGRCSSSRKSKVMPCARR